MSVSVLDQDYWREHPVEFLKTFFNLDLAPHQKNILKALIKYDRVSVVSANGVGKCVGADENIILSNGCIVKAKDLINKDFNILSFDPKSGNQMPQTAIAKDNGSVDCYTITTSSGRKITRTHNHPLLCGHLKKDYSFKDVDGRRLTIKPFNDGWKNCEDIKSGDLVLVPSKIFIDEVDNIEFSDDDAKLLGYLIGDGSTTQNVSFTQMDGVCKEEFIQICEKNHNCEVVKCNDRYGLSVYKIEHKKNPYVKNPVLEKVKSWGLLGSKAINKKLPHFTHSLPLSKLSLIINRLFSCDGYVWNNKTIKHGKEFSRYKIGITLASKELIDQLEILLLRFGINCHKRYKPSKYSGCDKIFDSWELEISKRKDIELFYKNIGIFGKDKKLKEAYEYSKNNVNRNKEQKWQNLNCPEGYHWEKVSSIEFVGKQDTVIISVDNTSTFLTTFCEHNSKLLSGIIVWFFYTHLSLQPNENTIVVFTAPTFAQVRDNLYYNIKSFINDADKILKKDLKHIISKSFGVSEEQLEDLSFLGEISQNQKLAEIRFNDVNYILGVSSSGENKVVGKHGTYVLIVFDEAQGIEENIYSDFNGILMSGDVIKQVMIGNSTIPAGQSSKFFNSFKKDSGFYNIKISAFDTPNFINPNIRLEDYLVDENNENYWRNKLDKYASKKLGKNISYYKYKKSDDLALWEKDIKKSLRPWSKYLINPISVFNIYQECNGDINSYEFLTRVRAEFPSTQSGTLIPQDFLLESNKRYEDLSCHISGDRNIGVDVGTGKDGSDPSVIAVTDGNKLLYYEEFNLDIIELREKLVEVHNEYNSHSIRIETDGVGQPFFDYCKPLGLPIIGIQTGSGAGEDLINISTLAFIDEEKKNKIQDLKRKFNCKRDELWWNFRESICPQRFELYGKSQILLPDDEKIRQELLAFTYERDKKIYISPKKEMRKRLKRSPNIADAIMFAFAEIEDNFSLSCGFAGISLKSNIDRNIY